MSKYEHLNSLRVAKPCPKKWEDMSGGDESRFCEHCEKSVHNLSAMSKKEATRLLSSGCTACVRYETDRQGRPIFRMLGLGALWAALVSAFGCGAVQGEAAGDPPTSTSKLNHSNDAMIGKVAVPSLGGGFVQSERAGSDKCPQVMVGSLSPPGDTSASNETIGAVPSKDWYKETSRTSQRKRK